MNAHELRESFLRFFEERGHRRLPSAPLVPAGDPTLLFTSAGMVQFKPYFIGQRKPPYSRLTTVQKCFRTSDIESVGDTSHLTFFEMLGNFSVSDYFKAEAIPWAWEFVTGVLKLDPARLWTAVYLDDDEAFDLWRQVGVPPDRIRRYAEEHNYWFSGDVGPCGPCSEIHYDFGEQFGCGPDCEPSHDCPRFLEIWNLVFMSFYCDGEKRTPLPSKNIDTGAGFERIASALLFESNGWDKGRLPSVYDTDLFAPVIRRIEELSGKSYGERDETDRAMRILAEHARAVTFLIGDERTPVTPSNEERGYVVRRLLRRAVYFARRHLGIEKPLMAGLAGDVISTMAPSYPELKRQRRFVTDILGPEERRFDETLERGLEILEDGVLALRRHLKAGFGAVRDQLEQWLRSPRASDLMRDLAHVPVDDYLRGIEPLAVTVFEGDRPPTDSLMLRAMRVTGGLSTEILLKLHGDLYDFRDWLGRWQQDLRNNPGAFEPSSLRDRVAAIDAWFDRISGGEAFELHDTYGFPIELTREIASEHGFTVDEAGFEAEMERQRERARAAHGGAAAVAADALYASLTPEATVFTGYEAMEARTKVVALLSAHTEPVEVRAEVHAASSVEVILDETPFYPEGGGQVGDQGEIVGPTGRVLVEDTQRVAERLIVHRGRVVDGHIVTGDEVAARVDAERRADTMRNHTATHLLHAALRTVLGTHVRQAGSLVAPDHLRFDFTHTEAVTPGQLAEVARLVNEKVRQNVPVHTRTSSFDQAISEGVLAFFGEKYGEEVRVVEVNTVAPRFSAELCGGTHCHRTGDIGAVVITGETSIGSGMRRIEALSGRGAEAFMRNQNDVLDDISRRLAAPRETLAARIEALIAEQDALRKRIEKMERSLASAPTTDQLLAGAVDVDGPGRQPVRVLAARVDAPSPDALRYYGDAVRKGLSSGVAVLASVIDGRPQFVAIVTPDVVARGPKAGEILKRVAAVTGGGGGGRPDMAQGGGKDASKIDDALAVVAGAVREMLSQTGPPPA